MKRWDGYDEWEAYDGQEGMGWGHMLSRPTVQTKTAPSKQSVIKKKQKQKKKWFYPREINKGPGLL